MNRITFLLCCLLLTACNYFENKKVDSQVLLEEELKAVNWKVVDTYPTFSSCDSMDTTENAKHCFQNTLIANVNGFLEAQNIVVTENVNDTIRLKIIIDNKGNLNVASINFQPETQIQIPEIDSLLRASLRGLPKIFPAIKRGQQVTAVFELPVVVQIN